MKIVLLRHAETDWNNAKKFLSRTDLPLNATGRQQAQGIRLDGLAFEPSLVASSPSIRTVETAEFVRSSNSLKHVPFELFADLREMDFGQFEGGTPTELRQSVELATAFNSWSTDKPNAMAPPGGESWGAAFARAESFLAQLVMGGKDALVVSHGYLLRLVMVAALGGSHPSSMRRFAIGNACYAVLELQDANYWRLTQLNVCGKEGS